MTWLLKLYPPRWRRRYGEEFLALIAPQRFSLGTAFDIIGGAIDAWMQPQSHLSSTQSAAQSEGDPIMLAKMRLRCAGDGEKVTAVDGLKGAAVIIGGSLLSVLVATWMHRQSVAPEYSQALMANGWLIAFVISMHYTSLKGWTGRAQALFIGAVSTILVLIAVANV